MQDRKRQDRQNKDDQMHSNLTEIILGCCFDVMNELGAGFLESVYKNALCIALKEEELSIEVEKRFEVIFRDQKVGFYIADLIVEKAVIVELKCCDSLVGEHQAQLINYLKASGVLVGLLVNFGKRKVEYKRLRHPDYYTYPVHHAACDHAYPVQFLNCSLFGCLKGTIHSQADLIFPIDETWIGNK
ncbi:MAG: GxxExxY protein [Parachlamydiaceae bacterium]